MDDVVIEEAARAKQLATLDRERQGLALDVEEGRPGAVDALEQLEARIAEHRRVGERRALAATERAHRTAAEEAAQAERARREAETAHAADDARFRAAALDVGRAVLEVREQVKGCTSAVARGAALWPVRVAAGEVLDAAAVAAASGARLSGRRASPVYGRIELLLRGYTGWRVGRDAASLLFGPLGPNEAHPSRELRDSLVRLFEGSASVDAGR
jgi:hypothetical protein